MDEGVPNNQVKPKCADDSQGDDGMPAKIAPWALFVLGILLATIALAVLLFRLPSQTDPLYYLAAAAACVFVGSIIGVLRTRIKSITISSKGVTLDLEGVRQDVQALSDGVNRDMQEAAKLKAELQRTIGSLQDGLTDARQMLDAAFILPRTTGEPVKGAQRRAEATKEGPMSRKGPKHRLDYSNHPDDPRKGCFGGASERHGRLLSASLDTEESRDGLYCVIIRVRSTDVANPLSGAVKFYLHPTFDPSVETVPAENNQAELTIVTYGSFTIGCVCDQGKTELELDLATIEKAPKDFREN